MSLTAHGRGGGRGLGHAGGGGRRDGGAGSDGLHDEVKEKGAEETKCGRKKKKCGCKRARFFSSFTRRKTTISSSLSLRLLCYKWGRGRDADIILVLPRGGGDEVCNGDKKRRKFV